MEALINLAREDEEIDLIARRAMENRSVQGVVLDIDPYWLTGWNYNRRFGLEGFDRLRERFKGRIYDERFFADLPENDFPVLPMHKEAFKDWPRDWVSYAKEHGFNPEMSPVRITICLRPGAIEVPRFESGRYRILYETRPVATLSGNSKGYRRPLLGGLSAGVGTKHCGTMGGVVRDQRVPPQKYGVTCAHVMTSGTVEQPAQIDSKRAAAIGTVSTHTSLQLPVGLCTPKSITGVNTVDIALIEIDPSTSADLEVLDIGPLTGVTPIAGIGQGQTVEFTGRSSGNRTLRVGGLGIIYKLKWQGQEYCFQNVIQLNWPKFYQLLGGRPVMRGDSGAWICNPDENGFGWCGMIIGEDRLHGYAIYAETIEDWWKQQGLTLTVT
jgi:hypothetical protein